ncbi:MAG TPA: prepilin-type N-terminal cleavage/methylation domain-containing protein [Luteibacter sp.]|jgi:general secretion pathway protein I|nr:prepilin-type N-terminal cleavage/methylation domain-containing protein [Luteibacter sp.]
MKRHSRGFSLLEVIAAIAVLAIAFAALMQVAGGSLSLTSRATERTQAALWARSLLDTAFVVDPVREGSSEGRFDDRYRWRLAVARWQPEDDPAADGDSRLVYRLDLDVLWGEGSQERSAHFSTLRMPGNGQPRAPGRRL